MKTKKKRIKKEITPEAVVDYLRRLNYVISPDALKVILKSKNLEGMLNTAINNSREKLTIDVEDLKVTHKKKPVKEVDYIQSEAMKKARKRLNHARIESQIALALYQSALYMELHDKVDREEELTSEELRWINVVCDCE